MIGLRSLAGGRLFARLHGSGPPGVVALHGWGRDSSDFDRVLDGLDGLAVDLPGFGASPPPDRPLGASGYADLILPVLDECPQPPVLLGHSFGGRVAVALEAATPGSVSGLVLTGVPLLRLGPRRRPSPGYRIVRWAHRVGLVPDRRMEEIRRRQGSADYRAASGTMREVLVTVVNESYEEALDNLACPVVLVWGAGDTEVPVDVAETARARLAAREVEVTLEVLPGVGHLVPVEAPAALRAAIERMPAT